MGRICCREASYVGELAQNSDVRLIGVTHGPLIETDTGRKARFLPFRSAVTAVFTPADDAKVRYPVVW